MVSSCFPFCDKLTLIYTVDAFQTVGIFSTWSTIIYIQPCDITTHTLTHVQIFKHGVGHGNQKYLLYHWSNLQNGAARILTFSNYKIHF